MKLSVVMATLNEEEAIKKVIPDIKKNTVGHDLEILVVDSSTDHTAEVATALGAKVIKQPKNGHGMALRTAFQAASGDVIITTDCDNTYPMDYIPKMLSLINQGFDLVSGNRINSMNRAMPLINRLANFSFALIVRVLYGIPTNDVTTGMFALRRQVARSIPWEANFSFPAEIIIRANLEKFKYKQIDIPYHERIGEVTLNRWHSGKAYLRCFLKYKFKLNFSADKI
ncbi:MAG: glycosyltransferase family 2 protein [bacterium]